MRSLLQDVRCGLIAHLLFGVAPGDRLAFAVAASTLLSIAAFGGFWPARRAMNTDPIIAWDRSRDRDNLK